jgi:hypothetical protein
LFEYKAKGGHNGRLSGVVIHLSRIVVEWAAVMGAVVIFLLQYPWYQARHMFL